MAALAGTVAARNRARTLLAALRRAFMASVAAQDPVAGFAGPAFTRMIADSPTLTSCSARPPRPAGGRH